MGEAVTAEALIKEDATIESTIESTATTSFVNIPKRHNLIEPTTLLKVDANLARPLFVGTIPWSTTLGAVTTVMYPFKLWFAGSTSVLMTSYRQHMRCTVCVTISGTTSPHHYGRMAFRLSPKNPKMSMIRNLWNIASSDNVLCCDASTCNTITLRLPFSLPYEFIGVNSATAYTTALEDVCELYGVTLAPLKRDDGGTVGTPRFNVFVHLEDVELCGHTPYFVAAPTPKKTESKIQSGSISSIAGAVSTAGKALKNVPVIGWAADAVAGVADAVGTVASWFGFSRPTTVKELTYTTTGLKLGQTTCANIPDESSKLTLFTETGYVATLAGVGAVDDALSWDYLIKRWGYLMFYSWAQSSSAGTLLATIPVHPSACNKNATNVFNTTPLSYFSQFADRWTGGLRYRFSVAASPYIKGSLLIAYTPNATSAVSSTLAVLTSTAQYCVLNLASEMDKTIEVGWHSNRLTKLCGDMIDLTTTDVNCNGYISIYVMEPIVASASSGVDLTITVHIAPSDDFFFSKPTDYNNVSYYVAAPVARYVGVPVGNKTDADKAEKDKEIKESDQKPITPSEKPASDVMNNNPAPYEFAAPEIYEVTDINTPVQEGCRFGYKLTDEMVKHVEVIPSFRALLKRYWRIASWSNTITNATKWGTSAATHDMILRLAFPMYPPVTGSTKTWSPNSATGNVNNPWNVYFNPITALEACFIGVSGSMRYKVIGETGKGAHQVGSQQLFTPTALSVGCASPANNASESYNFTTGSGPGVLPGYFPIQDDGATLTYAAARLYALVANIGSGFNTVYGSLTEREIVNSVELPYQSNYRYQYPTGNQDMGEADHLVINYKTRWIDSTANSPTTTDGSCLADIALLGSVGEDFSAFFFVGTPTLNVATDARTPVLTLFPDGT